MTGPNIVCETHCCRLQPPHRAPPSQPVSLAQPAHPKDVDQGDVDHGGCSAHRPWQRAGTTVRAPARPGCGGERPQTISPSIAHPIWRIPRPDNRSLAMRLRFAADLIAIGGQRRQESRSGTHTPCQHPCTSPHPAPSLRSTLVPSLVTSLVPSRGLSLAPMLAVASSASP